MSEELQIEAVSGCQGKYTVAIPLENTTMGNLLLETMHTMSKDISYATFARTQKIFTIVFTPQSGVASIPDVGAFLVQKVIQKNIDRFEQGRANLVAAYACFEKDASTAVATP